jgi:Do/DeqQ family serine protease
VIDGTRGRPLEGDLARPFRPGATLFLLLAGAVLGALIVSLAQGSRALPAGAGSGAPARDPASPGTPAPGSGPLAAADATAPGAATDGYAAIARRVMPAVVNIAAVQVVQQYEFSPFLADPFFREFFGDQFHEFMVPREHRSASLGSGVVVDERGTILTNYHVIREAREVMVYLADGRKLEARILGADRRTDLAALRVEEGALPRAVMGDSETIQVGDIVLAIGNPFGIGQTVTMGIVSAIGRGNLGITDYEDFIQTDAAINPGNSGGALVNTRGEVIGINTAIYSRSGGYQGIGFAIPSNMARDVLQDLVRHGRVIRGYSGLLDVQDVTPDIAGGLGLDADRGVVVVRVDPGGPAAAAGLRRGDVILSVRGRPVASYEDLFTQLSRFRPGDRVALGIARRGQRLEVELVFGEPPAAGRSPARRPGR